MHTNLYIFALRAFAETLLLTEGFDWYANGEYCYGR